MIRILKEKEYISQAWKNGQGSTSQIAIHPKSAAFPEGSFAWRVSTAAITGKSSFSKFPGYQRILLVCGGHGILFNGKKQFPFIPILFSGDEDVDCSLVKDPVQDLGIIYDPKKVAVEVEIHTLKPKERAQILLEEGTHFLFNPVGSIQTPAGQLGPKDTLYVVDEEDDFELDLSVTEITKLVRLSLFDLSF